MSLYAIPLSPDDGFKGFGPLGLVGTSAAQAPVTFTSVISSTIGLLTIVAIIWFVIQLLIGAISVMSAGGDKNKVAEASGKIRNSLIGLVLAIIAIFIFSAVGYLFGIDFIGLADLIGEVSIQ